MNAASSASEISPVIDAPAVETDDAAPRPKKRNAWIFRIVMAAVVLLAFAWFARPFMKELPRLRGAKPLAIALMVLVFIPTRMLTSEIMRLGLRALGYRIGVVESFLVSMVNAYANLLIPRAGLGLPAVYMKAKHKVPIADFSTIQLLPMTVLQITTIGLTGVICLAILRLCYGIHWDYRLMFLFAGVAVASFAATHIPFGVPAGWNNKVALFLKRLTGAWSLLSKSGHTISRSMLMHAGIMVLRAVRLQLAYWALGVHVNYFGVFIASLLADLAFFISVTPSALGFREGAIVMGAAMMGIRAEDAVTTAVLDRIVYSLVIVAIGQFGIYSLIRPMFRGDLSAALRSAEPLPGLPATPEVD